LLACKLWRRDVLPVLPVALAAVIAGEFCEIEICLLRAVRPDQNTSGATGTRSRSDLRDGTSNSLQGNAFIELFRHQRAMMNGEAAKLAI
jgi:hypothetical protein